MVRDFVWGTSVSTAFTRGNPADRRVDNCRVTMDSSAELTVPKRRNPVIKSSGFFSITPERDSIFVSDVGKIDF